MGKSGVWSLESGVLGFRQATNIGYPAAVKKGNFSTNERSGSMGGGGFIYPHLLKAVKKTQKLFPRMHFMVMAINLRM
jgi:hypothetical protein